MKKCSTCGQDKPLGDFHKKSANKVDGHQPLCKLCRIEKDKGRKRRGLVARDPEKDKQRKITVRKQYYQYMLDKQCILCDEASLPCLQFDHREPEHKKFQISKGIAGAFPWSTILQEIAKCDILCANCHAKRTAKQFNWYATYV